MYLTLFHNCEAGLIVIKTLFKINETFFDVIITVMVRGELDGRPNNQRLF